MHVLAVESVTAAVLFYKYAKIVGVSAIGGVWKSGADCLRERGIERGR